MYKPEPVENRKKTTVSSLRAMAQAGEKISCITAYDASFAELVDAAGIDVVLVGDSLGMVIQGLDSTVPVTVDDIVYHTKAVRRGLKKAFLIADMPFLSYTNTAEAVETSRRLMQDGGAQMVKLEGDALQADIVEQLSLRGVPVCAHLGLQPQLVHKLGGFKVQGRDADAADAMKADAITLQNAGADLLLLECVPQALAAEIAAATDVPVIGIGAGADVDGQILVLYDVLGLGSGRKPKFAKNYMANHDSMLDAVTAYVGEVKNGQYPQPEHSFD